MQRFLDRVRNGMVGAALRFGVEEGLGQITRTRARQSAEGDREVVGQGAEDFEVLTVGLPSGETSLKELEEAADADHINGVSLAEIRYLAGVPDPFGPIKLETRNLDFGEVAAMRAVRGLGPKGMTEERRRRVIEHVERSPIEEPDHRPRRYHANPDPNLDTWVDRR